MLFAPEHGLRGLEEAGDHVSDGIDDATGIPIVSLYGEQRQPSDSVMAELDILVFDIQDVGARFYTYTSVMGLSMQSAARNGVPFVVLDRPNPLGNRIEGPTLERGFESFVGLYPIPVVHGKTVGGLAHSILNEGWLEDLGRLDLTVVESDGWDPATLWPATGREWIPTSPNIPDFETALIYPGTCFFEGTIWSEGRGTRTPFKVVGYPGADSEAMAEQLNTEGLPGVRFEPTQFVPESIPGMASNPKHQGVAINGVRVVLTDAGVFEPVRTGFEMVRAALEATPEADRPTFFKERWFDLLAGTSEVRERIAAESATGSSR